MSTLLLLAAVWAILSISLLVLVRRDYGRGDVTSLTAFLLWPWHALNYTLLVLASALEVWHIELPAAVVITGWAAAAGGIVVIAAGFYEFRSVQRLSGTQRDELIDSGIYRYSRHPQYLGIILTLLGGALAGESAAAVLFAVVLSIVFIAYLPMEERYIQQALGERYEAYRERVPRLLGTPYSSPKSA